MYYIDTDQINTPRDMPGLVARRHNEALKLFGDRLAAGGLAPKAVIAAVMRKLLSGSAHPSDREAELRRVLDASSSTAE
jgi:hypothetical protein